MTQPGPFADTQADRAAAAAPGMIELRLYIAGQTRKSIAALSNLRKICEQHFACQYRIEVVDLIENPRQAQNDQIFAIPTLVRRLPEPIRRVIGDLSDSERVLIGLELRPALPASDDGGSRTA
jgi:circadian clock protein KaiB